MEWSVCVCVCVCVSGGVCLRGAKARRDLIGLRMTSGPVAMPTNQIRSELLISAACCVCHLKGGSALK